MEDLNNNKFIQITNEWFYHSQDIKQNFANKYGDRGFLLLCNIKRTLSMRGYCIFNTYFAEEWFNYTRKNQQEKLFNLLHQFSNQSLFTVNKKLISLEGEYNLPDIYKGNMTIHPLLEFECNYFQLYDYEINRILNINDNSDKSKLLLLFAALKYHYNITTNICYPTMDTIQEETGLSRHVIINGINTLQEIGLILYKNVGTKIFKNGDIRQGNNIYTMNYLGNDKKLSQCILNEKNKLYDMQLQIYTSLTGNKKRSISTKIRHLNNRFEKGKINEEQYNNQYNILQEQYEELKLITKDELKQQDIK